MAELLAAGAPNDTGRCDVLPLDLALRAHNHGVARDLLRVRLCALPFAFGLSRVLVPG